MAQFNSPNAFNRPFSEGRYDDIKPTYKAAVHNNATPTLFALRRLARGINGAVMMGAQYCRAVKGPASETVALGAGADILYLDPPYGGTLAYEDEYQILDRLLGDTLETSPFSGRDGMDFLMSLLEQSQEYPLWVISYGNAVVDLATLTAAIETLRPCRAIELQFAHMAAVASEAKTDANREFIILAGKGD